MSYEVDGDGQASPKFQKTVSLQCLYNISKKKLEIKLIFCKQINIKVLVQHFGHQSFLHGDTIITVGHGQAFTKYS